MYTFLNRIGMSAFIPGHKLEPFEHLLDELVTPHAVGKACEQDGKSRHIHPARETGDTERTEYAYIPNEANGNHAAYAQDRGDKRQ